MDQTNLTANFVSPGYTSHVLIKPGEELQYYLESTSMIAVARLEYTQDGGLRWITEKDNTQTVSYTGTVGTPLTGTVVLGRVKNETTKNKLYHWNLVSLGATSATITWHLSNHNPNRVHLYGETYIIVSEDQPANGTDGDGAGFAGPGSQYHCIGNPSGIYRNDGNATMPIWKAM